VPSWPWKCCCCCSPQAVDCHSLDIFYFLRFALNCCHICYCSLHDNHQHALWCYCSPTLHRCDRESQLNHCCCLYIFISPVARVFTLRCWIRECAVCLRWLIVAYQIFFYYLCTQVDCCHWYYSLLHCSSCWCHDAVAISPAALWLCECAVAVTVSRLLTSFGFSPAAGCLLPLVSPFAPWQQLLQHCTTVPRCC